ncbi:MAG: hypothetical protein QXI16_00775 [Sulfolobaceae archaeon]
MRFKDTKGAIVAQDEETIIDIRTDITKNIYSHLPVDMKRPILQNNMLFTSFSFGGKFSSVLHYYHPKTRNKKAGNMGRGQATTYAHLTEVAYYPNVDDINNFEATFSKSNDNRFYVYESTANGYNFYFDLWEAAKSSNTMGALFLGWWLKNDYVVDNEKDLISYGYETSQEEQNRIDMVKKLYGYDITERQLAWWRKTLKENIKDNTETNKSKLDQMLEMYPFTEYDAFRTSGYRYIDVGAIKYSDHIRPPDIAYEPMFFQKPELTELKKAKFGSIMIWEKEIETSYRGYILSFDPAYSTNPNSDRSVIQVYKCWKDRIEQVCEYASSTIDPIHGGWLFLKIGAMFNAELSIYEIDGGGKAVAEIIEYLRKLATEIPCDITNYARRMKQYLYRRVDSLASSSALQWVTGNNKLKIMSQLKHTIEDGIMIIHSKELLNELNFLIKDGAEIAALGKKHDDRVMTAAFAVEAWLSKLSARLPTYQEYLDRKEKAKDAKIVDNTAQQQMQQFGAYLLQKELKNVKW